MALDLPAASQSGVPAGFAGRHGTLYVQVANVLRQRIRSGLWGPGEQIPTLGELEKEFSVARVTLRQALSLLEAEGLIWRGRGRGTFVTEQAAPEWFKLATSRDELVHGLEGNWSELLSVDPTDSMPHLEPGDGKPVAAYRHMRRLHGRGKRAYAVVDMHLGKELYARAPKRFDREMIIPLLEKLAGFDMGDIRQTLTIGTADREVAERLSMPIGSPTGILRRVVRDASGRAVYVGVVHYRGDLVKLEMTVPGNGADRAGS